MNELSLSVDVGADAEAPLDFSLKKSPDSGNSSASETIKKEPLASTLIPQPQSDLTTKVHPTVKQQPPTIASAALSANLPSLMNNIFPASLAAAAAGFPLLGANTNSLQWMSQLTGGGGDTKKSSSKSMRPFKAYPKDPLSLPLPGLYGATGGNSVLPFPPIDTAATTGNTTGEELFAKYREQILNSGGLMGAAAISSPPLTPSDILNNAAAPAAAAQQVRNGSSVTPLSGASSGSNSSSTSSNNRKRPRTLPDDQKDEAYWERRRKNNEAAKRSRDARRAKEDEIAIRAAFLEQENLKLRYEIAGLKQEITRLRHALLNNNNNNKSPTPTTTSPPVAHSPADEV